MKEPVIQLENVTLRTDRGDVLFRDFNFEVASGDSAVIRGGAGSGKTLLTELLIGLRKPERGVVRMFGMDLKKRRRRTLRLVRRRIGGVGGPFGLIPSLTVAENITLPLVIAAERKKVQRERLLRMLSEFSLLKLAGKYPNHLTRVENTLVQFARAAIANQSLIILDEPSAGLDPASYQRVFDFLIRQGLSGRSILILASQDPPGKIPNCREYRLGNGVLE
jgi:ABC-type ATPase involved in cell division